MDNTCERLVGTFICCAIHMKSNKISLITILLAMTSIYMYKFNDEYGIVSISWVRIFWISVAVFALWTRTCINYAIPCIWMCITALFLRPWNLLMIPGYYISSQCVIKYSPSLFTKVMAQIWLAKVFYFLQGNDFTVGSVDISPGYIGLTDYYPILAGIQVLCHRYAFPIFGFILLLTSLRSLNEQIQMFRIHTIYKAFEMLFVCIVMLILRNHLFIWSVFSPRLLIEAVHTFILFIIIIIYFVIKNI